MRRVNLNSVLAVLALLVGAERANAAPLFLASAQVSGELEDSSPIALGDGPHFGAPVSASDAKSTSYVSGSGRADVIFVAPPGSSEGFTWELHTEAHMSWNKPFIGSPLLGNVTSTASWQDVVVLSNTDPLLVGHTLRLNFYADLYSNTPSTGLGGGDWEASTSLVATGSNGGNPSSQTAATGSSFVQFSTLGWDPPLQPLGDGFYYGTFHLDIPIVPGQGYIAGEPGSFFYSLTDTAQASGQAYTRVADAADPTGFTSITLPDVGNVTPESLGVSLTFASGIVSPNLSTVPEPSSLALFATSSLTALGYFGRRRKGMAAAK